MRRKLFNLVRLVLVIVLLVGIVGVIRQQLDYSKGDSDYEDAEQVAEIVIPEVVEEEQDPEEILVSQLAAINLGALQDVNEEVVGWIMIPDTEISYPVVQGTDDEYYLTHTWKKESSSVGAIFMEYQHESDLSGFNTLIYGHRMRNNTMFGSLKFYKDAEYWEEHPSIYYVNESGVYRYDIYSAYQISTQSVTYVLNIEELEQQQNFIETGIEHSVIDTGIVPTEEDRIITLSTCTGFGYSSRWVVQAVLRQEWPAEQTLENEPQAESEQDAGSETEQQITSEDAESGDSE